MTDNEEVEALVAGLELRDDMTPLIERVKNEDVDPESMAIMTAGLELLTSLTRLSQRGMAAEGGSDEEVQFALGWAMQMQDLMSEGPSLVAMVMGMQTTMLARAIQLIGQLMPLGLSGMVAREKDPEFRKLAEKLSFESLDRLLAEVHESMFGEAAEAAFHIRLEMLDDEEDDE